MAAETITRRFLEEYGDLAGPIRQMRDEGLSLRAIATRLNAEGHRTRRNAEFTGTQVLRILRAIT